MYTKEEFLVLGIVVVEEAAEMIESPAALKADHRGLTDQTPDHLIQDREVLPDLKTARLNQAMTHLESAKEKVIPIRKKEAKAALSFLELSGINFQ